MPSDSKLRGVSPDDMASLNQKKNRLPLNTNREPLIRMQGSLYAKRAFVFLMVAFQIFLAGACTSTSVEPYSRGGTGFRYNIPDTPARAFTEFRRAASPAAVIAFTAPSMSRGHEARRSAGNFEIKVSKNEISLEGIQVPTRTDIREQRRRVSATIKYSDILRMEASTSWLPPEFWAVLVTSSGEFSLGFYDDTTRDRFLRALELYLPHADS